MKWILSLLIIMFSIGVADAKPRHHQPVERDCFFLFCPSSALKVAPYSRAGRESATEYLAHPPGCPARAFCGCGAAYEFFGRPVRSLWKASAWFKFPRTSARSRTAAVRSHHVFVLVSHVRGDVWLVKDYNSGGHRSRLHERSIAGYTIVDPNG